MTGSQSGGLKGRCVGNGGMGGHHLCSGHFPVSGCRFEIKLKKPLHGGNYKPAAVYLPYPKRTRHATATPLRWGCGLAWFIEPRSVILQVSRFRRTGLQARLMRPFLSRAGRPDLPTIRNWRDSATSTSVSKGRGCDSARPSLTLRLATGSLPILDSGRMVRPPLAAAHQSSSRAWSPSGTTRRPPCCSGRCCWR